MSLSRSPHFLAIPLASLLLGLAGCGVISLGSGTLDDPQPSGTVVAQGTLSATSTESVSGVVSIWEQNSGGNCTFTLRLQSLSVPSDASLRVVPLVNDAPGLSPAFYTLRGTTGNQNYTFSGAPCGATWAQASITNPSLPLAEQTYGTATLQAP